MTGLIAAGAFLPTTLIIFASRSSCDVSQDPDCREVLMQTGIFSAVMTAASGIAGLYLLLSNKTDITLGAPVRPTAHGPSLFGCRLSPEGVTF